LCHSSTIAIPILIAKIIYRIIIDGYKGLTLKQLREPCNCVIILRLNLTFAASYETSEEAIKLIAGR
jgi:hypothetical protein